MCIPKAAAIVKSQTIHLCRAPFAIIRAVDRRYACNHISVFKRTLILSCDVALLVPHLIWWDYWLEGQTRSGSSLSEHDREIAAQELGSWASGCRWHRELAGFEVRQVVVWATLCFRHVQESAAAFWHVSFSLS